MAFKEKPAHQRLLMGAAAQPVTVLSLIPSVITSTLPRITAKQDAAVTHQLKVQIRGVFSASRGSFSKLHTCCQVFVGAEPLGSRSLAGSLKLGRNRFLRTSC